MQLAERITVAEIAANSLAAVRVFEKYGIDYCCGGKRPLVDICREKGQDAAVVQAELDAALANAPLPDVDWNTAPLAGLVHHIVTTHHEYLRRELPAIQVRLDKVYSVYNQRYGPTLIGLPETYEGLRSEVEQHIQKEEMMLFPAIVANEIAATTGKPAPPTCFSTVAAPINMMESEHGNAGAALVKITEITRNFELPEYACVTFRALMSSLDELEHDLHLHIHLENNILFPRAERMEVAQREKKASV